MWDNDAYQKLKVGAVADLGTRAYRNQQLAEHVCTIAKAGMGEQAGTWNEANRRALLNAYHPELPGPPPKTEPAKVEPSNPVETATLFPSPPAQYPGAKPMSSQPPESPNPPLQHDYKGNEPFQHETFPSLKPKKKWGLF